MLIQLQPLQISLLWDEILHSAVQANQVSVDRRERYGQKLLENLLAGKFQAWVCFSQDETRKLHAIAITTIAEDSLTGEITAHVLSLYGYRTLTDELALETWDKFQTWARANGCAKISAETGNERIKQLCSLVGLKPQRVTFVGEV